MPRAIALAVEGKSPPEIALAVRWPLWAPPEDAEGQASAIVPLLLAEGLLDERWREALREAVGDERATTLVANSGLRIGTGRARS